ncbi:MAG: hypothetical protein ACYTXA_13420 [Nostoc sp.]
MPHAQTSRVKCLQEIAVAMPTPGYAGANKIAKLTKELKSRPASCNQQ